MYSRAWGRVSVPRPLWLAQRLISDPSIMKLAQKLTSGMTWGRMIGHMKKALWVFHLQMLGRKCHKWNYYSLSYPLHAIHHSSEKCSAISGAIGKADNEHLTSVSSDLRGTECKNEVVKGTECKNEVVNGSLAEVELKEEPWLWIRLQGKGHGKIRLKTTYWPFTTIYSKPRKASKVPSVTIYNSSQSQMMCT